MGDRQKFLILVEISAIFAPYGAFSQKMSENVEKCIFSKLSEIHCFFIFSLKIDFKRCLSHESSDFDNRNMDNFRQKKLSWFLSYPPPKIWWKNFPCWKQQCCFLMCLVCAHTIFWFPDVNEPLTMIYAQLGTNRTFLEKVMHISSQFFRKK